MTDGDVCTNCGRRIYTVSGGVGCYRGACLSHAAGLVPQADRSCVSEFERMLARYGGPTYEPVVHNSIVQGDLFEPDETDPRPRIEL